MHSCFSLNSFIREAGVDSDPISCPLVEVLTNSKVAKGSQRAKVSKLNQTKTCVAPLPQIDANTKETGVRAHKAKASTKEHPSLIQCGLLQACSSWDTYSFSSQRKTQPWPHWAFSSEVFSFCKSPASEKEGKALFLPDLSTTRDCLSLSQI